MTPLDSAERLINLIIALQHAPVRMTRHQIRTTVAGYEQASDSQDPADVRKRDAAFERMFERDKDTLRAMGIPLETVTDATHGDDIGYRIRMDAVELPAVHLTATEAALVRVAVHLWDEARTSTVAQQ